MQQALRSFQVTLSDNVHCLTWSFSLRFVPLHCIYSGLLKHCLHKENCLNDETVVYRAWRRLFTGSGGARCATQMLSKMFHWFDLCVKCVRLNTEFKRQMTMSIGVDSFHSLETIISSPEMELDLLISHIVIQIVYLHITKTIDAAFSSCLKLCFAHSCIKR